MCNPANYCLNIVKLVQCTLICQKVYKHRARKIDSKFVVTPLGHPLLSPSTPISILMDDYPTVSCYTYFITRRFFFFLNLKKKQKKKKGKKDPP